MSDYCSSGDPRNCDYNEAIDLASGRCAKMRAYILDASQSIGDIICAEATQNNCYVTIDQDGKLQVVGKPCV